MIEKSTPDGMPTALTDIALSSDEIKVLKTIAANQQEIQQEKRWWKNYPLLVSVCAFLLSLITSIISAHTSHRKDINEQIAQFSGAIQSIQDLNFKKMEIDAKYRNLPPKDFERRKDELEGMMDLLSIQLLNTVRIAGNLGAKLGSNAPSAALLAVASYLHGYGSVTEAMNLFESALESARNPSEEFGALMWMGMTKANAADAEKYYLRAAGVSKKYGITDPAQITFFDVRAKLALATLLAKGKCTEAQRYYKDVLVILNRSERRSEFEEIRALRLEARRYLDGFENCLLNLDRMELNP